MDDDGLNDALREAGLIDDDGFDGTEHWENLAPAPVEESPPAEAEEKPKRRQCIGTTKAGRRCRKRPLKDGELCDTCDKSHPNSTRFQAGPEHTVGPGRPSKFELWRERVEEEFEDWIKPYYEMRNHAVKHIKMFDGSEGGAGNYLEEVIDIGARVDASEKVFDRLFGRPTSRNEITGADGGPLEVNLTFADLARIAQQAPTDDDDD